jgi:hypothetical protein
VHGAGIVGHWAHGSDLGDHLGKEFGLEVRHGIRVNLCAVFGIQQLHHILLTHSGLRVEVVLSEIKGRGMVIQRCHPGAVMQRHGVHEGAVAVENQGAERMVWNLEHVSRRLQHEVKIAILIRCVSG